MGRAGRSAGGRGGRILLAFLGIAICAGAAWLFLHPLSMDHSGTARKVDALVLAWAQKRGLLEKEAPREEKFKSLFRRWLRIERSYWYPPEAGRSLIAAEISRQGEQLGLAPKTQSAGRGEWVVLFKDDSGRLIYRIRIRPKVFVAVVIDDVGYNMAAVRRLAALSCRMTCTIIPFTPHSRAAARILAAHGKEVYVHMPMQPDYPMVDVPEYAIALKKGLESHEIVLCLERAFQDIPGAKGLNNHEGSVATQSPDIMAPLMAFLKERRLVFLDSVTNKRTVAWKMARESGIRWLKRDVFLDSIRTEKSVRESFWKLVGRARRDGQAVGIGHVYGVTLSVLESEIPKAQKGGAEFVFASSLAMGGE